MPSAGLAAIVAAVCAASPCDHCRLRERCVARRECCDQFALFVAGESERRWWLAPRAPSTARHAALFDEPAIAARSSRATLVDAEAGEES
jgi:hypothetical protein